MAEDAEKKKEAEDATAAPIPEKVSTQRNLVARYSQHLLSQHFSLHLHIFFSFFPGASRG
jgi:hypothetical protein